ncbi:hypothetical protein M438DRAFT_155390 [Aureobasidium pullulans EXF-150]|uniref:Uncharacterized protein n=1 Tax=Aureobasidium pullulans EXF-150 TaxID=1043002 RepID=A0A074X0E3_AURPU|nr:uncharacterized protein M438DRAFT_155390 [Aureobasidium pullulans EXF-150]KEQ78883.1 hypothetical protein M438DRAFT_155390 [Aureobasidium pullulans EXF-150]
MVVLSCLLSNNFFPPWSAVAGSHSLCSSSSSRCSRLKHSVSTVTRFKHSHVVTCINHPPSYSLSSPPPITLSNTSPSHTATCT